MELQEILKCIEEEPGLPGSLSDENEEYIVIDNYSK